MTTWVPSGGGPDIATWFLLPSNIHSFRRFQKPAVNAGAAIWVSHWRWELAVAGGG